MSGFEITGVLFGALPLLISGLEHYRDGLDSIQLALAYREVIADLVTTFRAITAGYHTTCERVLRQLMLTDDEYAELLNNPNGVKWKDTKIDVGIRQCLGVNYRPFLEIVTRLHRNILRFASKMNLDPDHALMPKWLIEDGSDSLRKKLANKSNRLFRSLNIGFESGKLDSLLRKIEADLRYLERMVPENVSKPVTATTSDARQRSIWKDIRESAGRLFDAMAVNWTCSSTHSHAASIRLEPRDVPSLVGQKPRFRVLLCVEGTALASTAPLYTWYDVEIESAEHITRSDLLGPASRASDPPQAVNKKKRVTISDITSSFNTPSINLVADIRPSSATVGQSRKIQSLCHCLQSAGNVTGCLGFLEDQSWRHQVYRPQQKSSSPTSLVTLRKMMVGWQNAQLGINAQPTPPKPLTLPEKYHMSYVLASAVLQLADTPWLPHSEVLYQVHLNHSGPLTRQNYPYLRNEFSSTQALSTTSPSPNRLISNEMTFTLGVVLIELFYGKPLEALRHSDDLDGSGNPTMMTDQLTATRLLDDIRLQQGDNFADAVQRCIYGSFNSATSTFENPTLQGQFYEGVIIPLKKIYDAL